MIDTPDEFTRLVYTVTEIAKADNEEDIVNLLSNSQITIKQTDYDNWNGGIYGYTIYISVDVKTFILLKDKINATEASVLERFEVVTRHLDNEKVSKVAILPVSNIIGTSPPNPHRRFSSAESKRRDELTEYLNNISEDELIAEILLPLFRQLGFHRITAAGHKDKALEYGKDIWMRYTLPTQHILYFGVQVKKGKIDAAGISKNTNTNVSEIHNQALMMLGHEIFDPEASRTVLVDHAFIVAGGEITKAAKNWIGSQLNTAKRSQILFMDRDDILNLFVVTNLPLPSAALPKRTQNDDLPF